MINRDTNEFGEPDPISFGEISAQTHGVTFNLSGTLALGSGYYYDNNAIDVYRVKTKSGTLKWLTSIKLGTDDNYAAFTHYTVWLDNRYALTATMQFGPTSLTPPSTNIIGPSVWLLDVVKGTAEMIIGSTDNPSGAGIFRSASDIGVANYKLYVAEEDSLDGSFGDDGYVSIFDIKDSLHPRFIKRLKPGIELPADFSIAHGITVTPDERFVYVSSYFSNYIIKIDTETDSVVRVFGSQDGIEHPHGGFIAGQNK